MLNIQINKIVKSRFLSGKKIILLSAIILSATISFAQKFEWLTGTEGPTIPGGTGANLNQSMVATDASGNVYVFGSYGGTLILGNDTLISYGLNDLFLAKMDDQGNYIWAEAIGTTGYDDGLSFAIDGASNIYITSGSSTSGTMFTPDSAVWLNNSQYNLLSFDTAGAFRWIRTGYLWYNLELAASLTSPGVYLTYSATLYKFDAAGNIVWQKTATATTGGINFSAVAVNDNGKLAFAISTVNLSGGGGIFSFDTVNVSFANSQDTRYIFECDTSGSALWGHEIADLNITFQVYSVAISNTTNEVYAGTANGHSVYFFANDTVVNPVNPGQGWGAVLKFDASGTPQWARAFYALNAYTYDIAINSSNDIIFCGGFDNSSYCIFGPFNLPPYGQNPFVGKLSSSGNYSWAKVDPRTLNNVIDEARSIATLPGNQYIVGGMFTNFFGTLDPYHQGCNAFAPGVYPQGHYFVNISENIEPVPVVDFSILQSANKVLFKDETQNATSIQWDFGDASSSAFAQPIHDYAQPGVYNVCLSASNNCGTNQLCKTVVVKGIRAIVTNHGNQDGVVTADILGGGFTSTTTVLLKKSGSPDMIPYFTNFINTGKLMVRLDLTAQTLGLWDVEVTVPGDTVMTLVNGFTIEPSTPYQFEVTYGGPGGARPNRWIPSQITIHNKTGEDAVGVVVVYRLDDTWNSFLNTSVVVPPQQIPFLNSGYQYLVANSLNTSLTDHTFSDTSSSSAYGAFIIPLLKANSFYTLPLNLRGTISIISPKVTSLGASILESSSLVGNYVPSSDLCFSDFFKYVVEGAFSISISSAQWNSCFPALFDSLRMVTSVQANDISSNGIPVSLPATIVSMLASMASSGCINGIPAVLTETEIKSVILKTLHTLVDSSEWNDLISVCSFYSERLGGPQPLPSPMFHNGGGFFAFVGCAAAGTAAGLAIGVIAPLAVTLGALIFAPCMLFLSSIDPNQISGPGDNADNIFLKPGNISSYSIEFENMDTATAAAQVVMITDTLDASRFDFSTFRFTSVTIGDSLKFEWDEPGNSQLKLSSLSPFSSDYLRTEATFDTITGIIQWIFTTVDPVNYQPVTNALAGFLPPNVNGTEGTGYVSYDVRLKSTLVTGDSINNIAQIIFDTNAPMNTNNWLNVIDIDKPLSAVNALPPNVNTASFLVSWNGTDFIAGIKSYNIYVSENDQPYYLWLPVTDTTQFTFSGVNGSKYEFISIAMDNAGNIEDPPLDPDNFPDAVTVVVTGIEEIAGDLNFSLYPNPVSSELVVRSSEIIEEIKIMDVLGNEILKVQLSKPTVNCQLPTANYNTGVYFIEVISENKKGIGKFMKVGE